MAIAVAEAQQGKTSASVTSLPTGTFATPPAAGDLILVAQCTGTPVTHTAPTDSAGHTAVQIGSQVDSGAASNAITLWKFENLTTGTGLSSYIVTGHWTSASGSIVAIRVTGQATPTAYNSDVASNTRQVSTNPASPTTAGGQTANSLFVGIMTSNVTAVATDGTAVAWTHVTNEVQSDNTTFDSLYMEHFIRTTTVGLSATWTLASSTWGTIVASFAPAGAAAVKTPYQPAYQHAPGMA